MNTKMLRIFLIVALALALAPIPLAQAGAAEPSAMPEELFQAVLESTVSPFAAESNGYRARSGGLDFSLRANGLQAGNGNGINWGISLTGFGRGEQVAGVADADIAQTENGLDYRRGALTEWYRDTAVGLEQGFTIHEAPGGRGDLVIQLDLSTDLEGVLDEDGRGLSFAGANGQTLRYDHLKVYDANAAELDARMIYSASRIMIEVEDLGAAYPLTIDPLIYLEQKIIASDGAGSDDFGFSVALSGDTALVGARNDEVGANVEQGSAYVFVRNGTTWSEQAKLTASDGAADDSFGYSVALSGDTALVGAWNDDVGANIDQGSAYVFVRSGTTWSQQSKLTASDGAAGDYFGNAVALSGEITLVGAYRDDVGANVDQGSAYAFVRSGTTWSQQAQLTASDGAASDYFGYSVALSSDTALVGAGNNDVGANIDQGSAYVFVRSGTTWTQQAQLTASDGSAGDQFGRSVALSGDTALVGAIYDDVGANIDQGSAYVFLRSGTTWSQQAKFTSSDGAADDYFGGRVALSGDTALVGAYRDDVGAEVDQGSAYFFVRNGTIWSQQTQLTASDGAAGESFGWVALSGDTALVGAMWNDVGANIEQGSVYFYNAYRTDADLAVSVVTGTNNPVQPGDTLLLAASVLNYGPASASAVLLDVPLPAGLTHMSHTATRGSWNLSSGSWSVGSLPMGVTATLTIKVMVASITDQTLAFTASVLSRDTNNANNAASLDLYLTTFQETVLNGGFNTYSGTSKVPKDWAAVNFVTGDGKNTTAGMFMEGTAAVKIAGAAGKVKTLTQTLNIEGDAGDLFRFSFWLNGSAIPVSGVCRVQLMFYNGGLRKDVKTILCPTGTYGYQQKTLDFAAKEAYTKVVIKITYSNSSGIAYFDALSLLRAVP